METINFVAKIHPSPSNEDQIEREEWYVVMSDGEKMNIISLDVYEHNKEHLHLWEELL